MIFLRSSSYIISFVSRFPSTPSTSLYLDLRSLFRCSSALCSFRSAPRLTVRRSVCVLPFRLLHSGGPPPHLCTLFVLSGLQGLCNEYSGSLVLGTCHPLCGTALPDSLRSHIDHIATHLFQDDTCWPLGPSSTWCFYLPFYP